MDPNTPKIAQQFIEAIGGLNRRDFDGKSNFVKEFVVECMMMEVDDPISPGSPAPSKASHPPAPTLASPKVDSTIGVPHAPSTEERVCYYYGITHDDDPHLLYRTSSEDSPWVPPTGRYAGLPTKHARPAYGTQLAKVWKTVGPQIDDLVHATIGRNYSIDPARFLIVPHGEDVEDGSLGPAIVWVTVHPDLNISVDTAHEVSQRILALLAKDGVNDVHVEWCEGVTVKLAGPPLLPAISMYDRTAQFRRHLTPLLGMPIASATMEYQGGQGSVGLYFHENKDKDGNPSDKVLAVTNRHILCKNGNKLYDFRANGLPRWRVRVCGSRRFQRGLDEIRGAVINHGHCASVCAEYIAEMGAGEKEGDSEALGEAQRELEGHMAAIVKLESLYKGVSSGWADINLRNIGILEYSPAILSNTNDTNYTKDFATIRLVPAKFKPNFVGNQVWLGTAFSPGEFIRLLNPHQDANMPFKFPTNGRLKIRGFVSKETLANPDSLDSEGQPCTIVMKDGCTTGLTVGHCAGLESFLCNNKGVRSVELAVYNQNRKANAFSAKGDSGSLIFNGKGEMVALLHSGKAKTGSSTTYVSYATPAWCLLEWIKEIYPHADFDREAW